MNEPKFTTAQRLKQLMGEQGLKQADLLRKCQPVAKSLNTKVSKSNISSYVNCRYNPNQLKLMVLARALNVDEAWLMGYDVPRERKDTEGKTEFFDEFVQLFSMLTPKDQQKAITILKTIFFD